MRIRTLLLLAIAMVVFAAACSSSSSGGGGGGATLSNGNYVSANGSWAPDGCNIQSQQPASTLNGRTEAVVVGSGSVTVGTEVFSGSGTSFTAAAIGTNLDLTGSGVDCILHQDETDSLHITGHDKFTATLALGISVVSGTQCDLVAGTLGTAFPCQTTGNYDSTKQ